MKRKAALLPVVIFSIVLAGSPPSLDAGEDDGAYVIREPQRGLKDIDRSYAEIPPVAYEPPKDRWERLPRTRKILAEGGTLRIVQLGDSIVNDTARSGWTELLERGYPGSRVIATTCVRGSTGCWWYKEGDRVQKYVLDHAPDLVVIGGISQREDIDSIRTVIEKIRRSSPTDILLLSGAFGDVDPRDDRKWAFEADPAGHDYRARLARLAKEMGTAFLDLHAHWGKYIRSSGRELAWFKRDPIHANERGEQVLGRILERHFAPGPSEAPPGEKSRPPGDQGLEKPLRSDSSAGVPAHRRLQTPARSGPPLQLHSQGRPSRALVPGPEALPAGARDRSLKQGRKAPRRDQNLEACTARARRKSALAAQPAFR